MGPREQEFVRLDGHVRSDAFGRVIVDVCPSDVEHLVSSETDPETNRPQCRYVVERLFERFVGRKGLMSVTVSFYEETEPKAPISEV